MSDKQKLLSGTMYCRIRVHGQLGDDWREYFENMRFAYEGEYITVISGIVEDQSALHGILAKIRSLGLPLLYVECNNANNMRNKEEDHA